MSTHVPQLRPSSKNKVGGRRVSTPRFNNHYLPMLPGISILLALSIYPTIYSLYVAVHRYNLTDPINRKFVGLRNFGTILSSTSFWHSLRITLVYMILAVTIEFILAFILSLVFFRPMPFHRSMRTLILIPMLTAPIVVGLLGRFIFDAQFGIANTIMQDLGLGRHTFFDKPAAAFYTLVSMDIWQWTPFLFLILLAAMQGIPEDLIDAAKLDGANRLKIIWHIFVPLLRYPILVGLTLRVIDAARVYDIIYATTRGGPIDATTTMSWNIYDMGFKNFDVDYSSAYSWLLLIFVLLLINRFLKRIVSHDRSQA